LAPFGQAVSEEKILKKSTNQKQELSVVAMFVNGSGRNEPTLADFQILANDHFLFLAHSFAITWRPSSVSFLHFNLLL
jgi:hypothetical protein